MQIGETWEKENSLYFFSELYLLFFIVYIIILFAIVKDN